MGQIGLDVEKGLYLGIDFGTTNCVVSIYRYDEDDVITIPIDGHKILPTVIQFDRYNESEEVLECYFGYSAKEAAVIYPESTVTSIKRILDKDEAIEIVVEGKGHSFKAEDIVAKILGYIKEKADAYLREELYIHGEFTGCVITVPANSTDKQKKRTKNAAVKAGFNEKEVFLRLEPAAAAIQYAVHEEDNKKVLIYDFGGGTFDACVLSVEAGSEEPNISILSTYGNNRLGGDDIDYLMMDFIYNQFVEQTKGEIDLFAEGADKVKHSKMHQLRLRQAANRAKEQLSETISTKVVMAPFIQEPEIVNLNLEVTRDLFMDYRRQHIMSDRNFETFKGKNLRELINETLVSVDYCLKNAGLECDDIDEIFLVGGSSCIPAVKEAIDKKFSKEPYLSKVSPAFSISTGAAHYCNMIMSQNQKGPKVKEVTIHPLGLEISGRRFYEIVKAGVEIPKAGLVVEGEQLLETNFDDVSSMSIVVYENTKPCDNGLKFVYEEGMKRLSGTTLRGIPLKGKGEEKVKVVFKINQDNMLTVEAKSISTDGISTTLSVDELY